MQQEESEIQVSKKRYSIKQSFVYGLSLAVGLILIAIGLYGIVLRQTALSGTTTPPSPTEVLSVSTDTPLENDLNEDPFKNVPKDQPKRIELPSIDAAGYIQKVSVDATNTIVVPSHVELAGWYVGSAKPGDKGVSLIDGHLQGIYRDGVFKRLSQLKKDDVLHVVYGDDSKRTFQVVAIEEMTTEQASVRMLEPAFDIEKQLNLITCAGAYNKETRQYEKRTIVIAKAI